MLEPSLLQHLVFADWDMPGDSLPFSTLNYGSMLADDP